MIWTGSIMFVFVAVHIATMKYGAWYPAVIHGEDGRDLYRLVARCSRTPRGWRSTWCCMAVVGFHLWHGFSSAFESLGLEHPRLTPKVLAVGRVLAVIVGAGFFSIPAVPVLHRGPIMNGAPRIAPAGTRQLDAQDPVGPDSRRSGTAAGSTRSW